MRWASVTVLSRSSRTRRSARRTRPRNASRGGTSAMADPLSSIARRAEERPTFLANLLAAYARSEDLDDDALAARLGCPAEQLSRLKLCRAPRSEPTEM